VAVAKFYGPALLSVFNKEIDWESDTVQVALLASTYTPNQDTHRYFSDVSSHQSSGTGYTAGGQVVTSRTAAYDAGTNTLTLDCANPAFAGLDLAFKHLVFYVNTGTPSTSPLVCYVTFDTEQSPESQDVTFIVPPAGLVQAVASA
jgi:hypothetical protein